MISLAIIGILATLAIPNFMTYQAKAKQSEAKTNLKGVFTVEQTYFAENNTFAREFTELQWEPLGPYRYAYSIGGETRGLKLGGSYIDVALAQGNDPPGATRSEFTAIAWGNIDADTPYDTWEIGSEKAMENVNNDVVVK